jgi:hypothetical protein
MNRESGMSRKLILISLISLSTVACQQRNAPVAEEDISAPTTVPCCQYIVSGGVAHPGPRLLVSGDTISTVIARDFANAQERPCTVVLIRQAPEGKTHQLIQLDASGKLIDEKQDWLLRNGDELVFPGGDGSNSTRNPTGPQARASY